MRLNFLQVSEVQSHHLFILAINPSLTPRCFILMQMVKTLLLYCLLKHEPTFDSCLLKHERTLCQGLLNYISVGLPTLVCASKPSQVKSSNFQTQLFKFPSCQLSTFHATRLNEFKNALAITNVCLQFKSLSLYLNLSKALLFLISASLPAQIAYSSQFLRLLHLNSTFL